MEVMNVDASCLYSICLFLVFLLIVLFFKSRRRAVVYVLDYACFKPPPHFRVPIPSFIEHSRLMFEDYPKLALFQRRILEKAGIGDEAAVPHALQFLPPLDTLSLAIDEARLVMFSSIDEVLAKTAVSPCSIDFLITNCSVFCPSPSLSSMIVNKYNMKSSVKTYNLSGMGCSAGAIAVDVANSLLRVWPNSYALIVTTEILTPNNYIGSDRSMVVASCLFRMGCSSILLTNKHSERVRSKYQLLHIVRTHKAAQDEAYNVVRQQEDFEGKLGIALSKDLMSVAGEALKSNMTALGPLVLPISEQLKFVLNFILIRPYVPKFKQVFDHICIHTGGPAVINEIQKSLGLSELEVEASRMTLHRFGNTSSSSIWYALSYIEAKGRMKAGNRIWQMALGSGFKCNSMVWKCVRDYDTKTEGKGPWKDSIDNYPLHIPEIRRL